MSFCIYFHAGCTKNHRLEITKRYTKWQFFSAVAQFLVDYQTSNQTLSMPALTSRPGVRALGERRGDYSATVPCSILLMFLSSCILSFFFCYFIIFSLNCLHIFPRAIFSLLSLAIYSQGGKAYDAY